MAKYIPEQHYIGIKGDKTETSTPLAFLTPDGTDKAAKNRKETVDSWTRGWPSVKSEQQYLKTLKNVGMTGFRVTRENSRWSTSNVVWRIEDPRGFELEIYSPNMAYLMANCVIDHGTFKDELIWARDGAKNYLIPTSGEVYDLFATKPKVVEDFKVLLGQHITFPNGESGFYLGEKWVTEFEMNVGCPNFHVKGKYHIFCDGKSNYTIRKTVKKPTISKKKVLTQDEIDYKLINAQTWSWRTSKIYTPEKPVMKDLISSAVFTEDFATYEDNESAQFVYDHKNDRLSEVRYHYDRWSLFTITRLDEQRYVALGNQTIQSEYSWRAPTQPQPDETIKHEGGYQNKSITQFERFTPVRMSVNLNFIEYIFR